MNDNFRSTILISALLSGSCALASCGRPPTNDQASNAAPAGAAPAAATPAAVDYGVLGPPDTDGDPKVASRSARANLARFRHQERHPPQGTIEHPLEWLTIIEMDQTQRARFYAAEEANASLITDQDRKWLKGDEDTILSLVCSNRDAAGVPLQLTAKDCAGVPP